MHIGQSPKQPAEQDWKFIKMLQKPLHTKILFSRTQKKQGEAALDCGVTLDFRFPGDDKLASAYADFRQFLKSANLDTGGSYKIVTEKTGTDSFEIYTVEVSKDACRILSNDTEGIRRGLVFVEDEIQRNGGPFLKIGSFKRSPFIKTRISRCFFGPIKRPPMNRDELADNVDYYPEEYLNRLAHEGINGLWLTITFKDLCPSELFSDHGKDSAQRLAKLEKTAKQCARYGIKIYVFCIEPHSFGPYTHFQNPLSNLEKHPDLGGHHAGANGVCFCTSSEKGQKYLEDCANYIFTHVPILGGLIDINLGEGAGHCYGSMGTFFNNNCPRCSTRKPWEVFHDTTSAIARGMQKANPEAEMISWLYTPSLPGKNRAAIEKTEKVICEIAAHVPDNVIFQYNFESNGKAFQLGRERTLLDYWLAWPGPSKIFSECTGNAVRNGARASAKIQVGCSHEVATIPFVPVPGNLYKKYKAMRKLKISSVMQCWYFGNYPGLMNKSAGELSFDPFPESEDDFLLKLAKIDWGVNAEKTVSAWKYFQKGYSNFPFNLSFTWYGPVHNSVVWPLYLNPADAPISPSWQFTFPLQSGDRIGECICYDHTLQETLVLLKEMSENWNRGVKIFEGIESEYVNNPERMLDICLAKALNLQFSSAYNIFRFYAMREQIPYRNTAGQKDDLGTMKEIVLAEIKNSLSLRELCFMDSRLGFHSEAEGYKYHPKELKWRAENLEKLLLEEFPAIAKKIEAGEKLFPGYTGAEPEGKKYVAGSDKNDSPWEKTNDELTKWKAWHDGGNLCFEIQCKNRPDGGNDGVELKIEPCRLWPAQSFSIWKNGDMNQHNFKVTGDSRWQAQVVQNSESWTASVSIPFSIFDGYYIKGRPMRINVLHEKASWVKLNPWEGRLRFGGYNPADLGWLFFQNRTASYYRLQAVGVCNHYTPQVGKFLFPIARCYP